MCVVACDVSIVTDVLGHQQPSHACDWKCLGVSVEGSGDLVIQEEDHSDSLHLYSRHEQKSTELQSTIQAGSEKYKYIAVSSDAVYCQEDGVKDTTHKYNRHDDTKSIITHPEGDLVACLPPASPVYACRDGRDWRFRNCYYINIRHPDGETTLRPPGGLLTGRKWAGHSNHDHLSVVGVSDQIIVTSHEIRSMDIFSLDGKIVYSHTELSKKKPK